MELLLNNHPAAWIIIGFALLAIEAIAFGFGSGLLMFGSLGAILTGIVLWFGLIPNQFIFAVACFAVLTALVTAGLWKPLKRLQSKGELGNDRSSDLIGHTFSVTADTSMTQPSEIKFSGINWRVEPEESGQIIPAGTQVRVSAVQVGLFRVQTVST